MELQVKGGIGIKTVRLRVPLRENDITSLNIGDAVYFDGVFYTGRTLFQRQVVEKNILPPIDFPNLNLFLHVGPVMRLADGRWEPVSIDPTSSFRFEKFGASIIKKLNVRAIVGKTTMGPATMEAMKEYGCVHLTKVGIYGKVLASRVKRVVDVYNLKEFGITEATWLMEAENFGPFIVDMDTKGRNYFEFIDEDVSRQVLSAYERFGVRPDFKYTAM